MLEAPTGSAHYTNEYGRPNLTGFFRTHLTKIPVGDGNEQIRGFHKVCHPGRSLISISVLIANDGKPEMLAGGLGT